MWYWVISVTGLQSQVQESGWKPVHGRQFFRSVWPSHFCCGMFFQPGSSLRRTPAGSQVGTKIWSGSEQSEVEAGYIFCCFSGCCKSQRHQVPTKSSTCSNWYSYIWRYEDIFLQTRIKRKPRIASSLNTSDYKHGEVFKWKNSGAWDAYKRIETSWWDPMHCNSLSLIHFEVLYYSPHYYAIVSFSSVFRSFSHQYSTVAHQSELEIYRSALHWTSPTCFNPFLSILNSTVFSLKIFPTLVYTHF